MQDFEIWGLVYHHTSMTWGAKESVGNERGRGGGAIWKPEVLEVSKFSLFTLFKFRTALSCILFLYIHDKYSTCMEELTLCSLVCFLIPSWTFGFLLRVNIISSRHTQGPTSCCREADCIDLEVLWLDLHCDTQKVVVNQAVTLGYAANLWLCNTYVRISESLRTI